MHVLLWVVVAVVGVLVLLPVVVVAIQAPMILSSRVTRAEGLRAEAIYNTAAQRVDPAEAARLGFRYEGSYLVDLRVSRSQVAMWQHGDEATYLAVYQVASAQETVWVTDLVSILSLEPTVAGLTTGTSRDAHTLPEPAGWYVQSFDEDRLSVLWEHHGRGEAHAAERIGGSPRPVDFDGGEALGWFLRYSMKHLLTHPWRVLYVPWRFWVGRHVRHDKPLVRRV